jgi:hypothetical protein
MIIYDDHGSAGNGPLLNACFSCTNKIMKANHARIKISKPLLHLAKTKLEIEENT